MRIKAAASVSARVFFTKHAQTRFEERDISTLDVLDCLRHGRVVEGPAQSAKGNWQFTVSRFCAGEVVTVAGALELDEAGDYIIVITAYRG